MSEKNKEIIDKIIEVGEDLKFDVRVKQGCNDKEYVEFTFSKYSPFGQDFSFDITTQINEDDEPEDVLDTFIGNLDDFYESYDVSYETYLWLDEWGHGKNGAPYDMRDLYNDFKACENYIEELLDKVKGIEI